MHLQTLWPVVQHENRTWLTCYESGWTQLRHHAEGGISAKANASLRWIVYCARYAWPVWPLRTLLDRCDTGEIPPAWLEWEAYRLSGDTARLHHCFQRWATRADEQRLNMYAGVADPFWCVIDLQALAWITAALGKPEREGAALAEAADHFAQQMPHAGDAARQFDRDLARLWATQRGEPGAQTADLLAHRFAMLLSHVDETTPAQTAAWVERGLLLLSLLRRGQEPEWVHRLAMRLLEMCVTAPDLHIYVPPLLIDGVLGCEADAPSRLLSWWLYASPPLGIDRLQIGAATITLQVPSELGQGTQVSVQCSDAVTLEIFTPETSYLEHLLPGTHRLTLTVLDRTDVKTA